MPISKYLDLLAIVGGEPREIFDHLSKNKLGKIVLITGGNSGIGLTAKWFVCLISSQFGNNYIVLFQYEY